MFLERKPTLWRWASIGHYISVRVGYLNPMRWGALVRKISFKKIAVAKNNFIAMSPPQKEAWRAYWLATGAMFPDGNMCVKKEIFYACAFAEKGDNKIKGIEQNRAFFDFYFNFNSRGYLSWCVPIPANFGRIHAGQITQGIKESAAVESLVIHNEYMSRIAHFSKNPEWIKKA